LTATFSVFSFASEAPPAFTLFLSRIFYPAFFPLERRARLFIVDLIPFVFQPEGGPPSCDGFDYVTGSGLPIGDFILELPLFFGGNILFPQDCAVFSPARASGSFLLS